MLQRSRGFLITTVVFVLAVVLLVERSRKVRYKVFLVFLVMIPFLTIAANLLLVDRGTGYLASKVMSGKGGLDSYELEVDPFTLVEDNLFFLSKTFKVVPAEVPHRSPFELYYYMALNPIPRVLWPDKPWMDQKYLGRIRPYYAAVTIIGDFYIYGGWLHIIAGAIVFGLILKHVDRFGKARYPPENGRIILYAFIILSLFYSIRALWSLFVSMYSLVTSAFVLYLVRRRIRKIRGLPEGNQDTGGEDG